MGLCWEMDYNIRAARADFLLGVWVGAAYAYRYAHTERRRATETDQMRVTAVSTKTVSAVCG
jgi:hypothetical protein